jgi:hypothetical protein
VKGATDSIFGAFSSWAGGKEHEFEALGSGKSQIKFI